MTARSRFGACVLSCVLALFGLAACGEEGMSVTPDTCPELTLYDIKDERSIASARAARREAERGGCITPVGTALTDPNERPPASTGGGTAEPADGGGGAGGTTG